MTAFALPTATEPYVPPTISDTHLPEVLPWLAEYGTGFGKQMIMIILSIILIVWFFKAAIKNPKLVPGKTQFLAESAYSFVRNGIGRDIIGEKNFAQWVPLLFATFFFVLLNNLFGAIPFLQIPSFSHAGSAYAMAIIIYGTWIAVGVKNHGIRYFKLAVVPSGVPGWIMPLMVPLEIISNFIVRPLTHSLRLMATMLAGHMIVMLAASGARHLIVVQESLAMNGIGIAVIAGSVAMYFLELLIMVLQAFVFALLTAIYIQGALDADAH
ncbi:F0F1 ATP synthase subunit A [Paeniglutamicibacter gangotriensis]|uniref:ATP synthase subunit a n=1 Tax=Paeniglutamicibacter gangotriensis TaxID=254787 RepID=A0A5B0ELU0_9MICC|nr:F0F1 ATP synthase subunit A [Paeniglutamicibacter gangotriensis]KAA0978720.1 F0F1 ATP synthase subunit A [Paeniglutamicibacter gangotriensis]